MCFCKYIIIYLHGSGHEQGSSPLEAKYDRAAEHTTANGEKVCWTVLEHLYFGTDIHKYYMNQYFKIEFVSVNIILIPLHSN